MGDREIERVRRDVAGLAEGPGRRYPKALKRRIARAAEGLRVQGLDWVEIAGQLCTPTVKRIVEESRGPETAFVPVEVTGVTAASTITIVTPGGYRVEGLNVAETTDILRRLG
jgi:hypothetical protein